MQWALDYVLKVTQVPRIPRKMELKNPLRMQPNYHEVRGKIMEYKLNLPYNLHETSSNTSNHHRNRMTSSFVKQNATGDNKHETENYS